MPIPIIDITNVIADIIQRRFTSTTIYEINDSYYALQHGLHC